MPSTKLARALTRRRPRQLPPSGLDAPSYARISVPVSCSTVVPVSCTFTGECPPNVACACLVMLLSSSRSRRTAATRNSRRGTGGVGFGASGAPPCVRGAQASTRPPNRVNSTRQGRLRAPRPPAARLGTFGRCEPGPLTLARALPLSESPWHPSPCRHARTGGHGDGATGRFHVLAESGNALRARVAVICGGIIGLVASMLVFWERTRACSLACRHWRAAAQRAPLSGELSSDQGMRLIDDITGFGMPKPVLTLTGGACFQRPAATASAIVCSPLSAWDKSRKMEARNWPSSQAVMSSCHRQAHAR